MNALERRQRDQEGSRVEARAVYDVEAAIQDDRPRFGAHETRNPANQWLANLRSRTRQAAEVAAAGVWAQEYVRRELYARLPWLRYGRYLP